MSTGKTSTHLGAIVNPELKDRLKKYANAKRWSMSQAVGVLLEEGLERYEQSSESESKSNDDKNEKSARSKPIH